MTSENFFPTAVYRCDIHDEAIETCAWCRESELRRRLDLADAALRRIGELNPHIVRREPNPLRMKADALGSEVDHLRHAIGDALRFLEPGDDLPVQPDVAAAILRGVLTA
jgi:hypothetical protein